MGDFGYWWFEYVDFSGLDWFWDGDVMFVVLDWILLIGWDYFVIFVIDFVLCVFLVFWCLVVYLFFSGFGCNYYYCWELGFYY